MTKNLEDKSTSQQVEPSPDFDAVTCVRDMLPDLTGLEVVRTGIGAPMKANVLEDPTAMKSFPIEVLPPGIQEFVTRGAKAMACPIPYLVLPVLSVLASAIGNSRRIQVKPTFTLPSVIWTVVVGEAGTTKSPPFKLATAPLWDVQAHELTRQRCPAPMPKKQKKSDDTGQDLVLLPSEISAPPLPMPKVPARVIVADVTIAALAPILQENPRGLLVASEELDGWFKSFSLGGASGRSSWLKIFDASQLDVDRKTGRDRHIYVQRAAVSLTGTIQPAILRRALSAQACESGLAGRLLFTLPPRVKKVWTEDKIPPELEAKYACTVDRLRELPMAELGGKLEPINVPLDEGAKRSWITFYNQHAEQQAALTGDLASAWAKLESYAARFALVIHLTRWAEGDSSVPPPEFIDAVSMDAGITLTRWFASETRRVYAMLNQSPVDADRLKLVAWIQGRGGNVSVRDLTHDFRKFRKREDAATAALDDLVKRGLGQWEDPAPSPQGGHPIRIFRLASGSVVTITPT